MSAYQAKFLKLQPESIPGFIYLVQAVGTDRFKIGRAINVPNRLRGLQTSSPLKIRYVYHAYVQNMNLCEMELHHKFSEQREIGEWFALTQQDVKFCIFLMRLVQILEPPEQPISQEIVSAENCNSVESIIFSPEPEITPLNQVVLDKALWWKVEAAQVEGKTTTWIIENILNKKGRKFSEGKKQLEELINKFGEKGG